jgi:biopolymer transport protein TolR
MRSTFPAAVRAEPNVTPMIDVMLVLLIIFMAVGPLLVDGFRANPPSGQHLAEHPEGDVDAVIGLDSAGRYFLNKVPMSEGGLRAALQRRFSRGPLDRVVYLRADKDLEFRKVQGALALASDAGARLVGLITSQEHPMTAVRPTP